jgi:hypothetical protein
MADQDLRATLRVEAVRIDPDDIGLASEEAGLLLGMWKVGRLKHERERWEDRKRPVIDALWKNRDILSSVDLYRLAGLCLKRPQGDDLVRARRAIEMGLSGNPENEGLVKLKAVLRKAEQKGATGGL